MPFCFTACTTVTCEEEIKKVAERIKKMIKIGDSELGIPSFDPLEVAPFFRKFDEESIRYLDDFSLHNFICYQLYFQR